MKNFRICFSAILAQEVHESLVRDVTRYRIISVRRLSDSSDSSKDVVYLVIRPVKCYASELLQTIAKLHKAGIITLLEH